MFFDEVAKDLGASPTESGNEKSRRHTAVSHRRPGDHSRQYRGDWLPESGRARSVGDDPWCKLYEHYRIAYLVKPGGNIEILGVFHGALDIDRYFI